MIRAEPDTRGFPSLMHGRAIQQPEALPTAANLALRSVSRPEVPSRRFWPARRRSATTPVHRAIVAVDIEDSTSRTNPIKEELRGTVYQVLMRALRAVGIGDQHLDRLTDRGDGLLALVRPADEIPKTLLIDPLIPTLSALLSDYNRSAPALEHPARRLRLRTVVHAGEVHDDGKGFFGEPLDVAFRLLDAAPVRKCLRRTMAPLVLVVSDEIFWSIVWHGYNGIDGQTYEPLVHVRVAGRPHRGWIHFPVE